MPRHTYTNEKVDELIKSKNITRVDNYISSHTKINFSCVTCGNVWASKPYKIIQGNGCPKCNGGVRMTNEEFDKSIANKNVVRISDYMGYESPIKMKCLKDGHIWEESRARNIIKEKTPCPLCYNTYKSEEQIDLEIRSCNKNIQRLDSIKRMKDKIHFRCNIDNEIFLQSPIGIIWHGYGCPFCKRKRERFVKELLQKSVECIDYQKAIFYNGKRYIVDFFIEGKKKIIIEYNGKQHYEPVRFGGMSYDRAEKCFETQKVRDCAVKKYCEENQIVLVELPYWLNDSEIINKVEEMKWLLMD
jgi:Zn-finger nucleic acid-binding protein